MFALARTPNGTRFSQRRITETSHTIPNRTARINRATAVPRALKAHKLEPSITGAPYWMDSALIAAKGIPIMILGPTAHDLHGANERVDLSEVETLEQILLSAIQDFCA
jgi:acetylornithine deacetylase/succinyl-diaminopimelate desuccinylase-like protein